MGFGYRKAKKILKSGMALQQMERIIEAQGKKRMPPNARLVYQVKTGKDGKITHIDNKILSKLARVAGAPLDPAGGLLLKKKLDDKVKKGETLFEIHSNNEDRMRLAKEISQKERAYIIK